MAASKASKVLRRTVVGGTLAAVLAAVLWAAGEWDSAWPVLGVCALLLAVGVFEAQALGSFAGKRLAWPLAAGAFAALAHSALLLRSVGEEGRGDSSLGVAWLAGATLSAFAAILGVYSIARGDSWPVRVAGVLVLVGFAHPVAEGMLLASVVAALFLLLRHLAIGARRRSEAAGVLALGTLLSVSLPALTWIWFGLGFEALVALIAIAKLGDTAAYFTGSAIGRTRPFPGVSPGKTTEGFVGSFVVAGIAGALAAQWGWLPTAQGGWAAGLAAALAVNVAAQASDLLESWVKRRAGVKDSGAWFGPSGGMLDLVDSFFLSAPLALVVWPVLLD